MQAQTLTQKSQPETIVAGQTGYSVPLVISVTGHRDLLDSEIPHIRTRVREFLTRMLEDQPNRSVTVMSSLAEGADQLVADEAIALGIPLIAPLPMPKDLYREDFHSADAKQRFDALLAAATEVFELPIATENSRQAVSLDGDARNLQYAKLGVFLCAHCHILLALWDGKHRDSFGGTGDVVRFHHDDVVPGMSSDGLSSRLILADDESDLIYHIVCSRDRSDGQPKKGLTALSACWFTTDDANPRTADIPARYVKVFERTGEFSQDAEQHKLAIKAEGFSLADGIAESSLPGGARDIDQVFAVADWLAIYFQKRHLFVLRATHALALLMGVMYIAYSDIAAARAFVVTFIVLFAVAAIFHRMSRKMAWHRKYLDYRTLAEGLRVQFYWSLAGISSDDQSKFAHDNFLQLQDAELGWIRNVMRVAGLESNIETRRDESALDDAINEWIGDEDNGQLGYYRKKTREKILRGRRIERLASTVLWAGAAAIGLFAFASADIADLVRDELVVLMGGLLLMVGVGQSYSFATADFELIKQYEFMCRTFTKARQRLLKSKNSDERRHILRLVGQASLDEHAEWLLMHRERSVSEGDLWRMVGG